MSLFRNEAPLDESAEAAAALIGDIDAETLVKDYWVTEALRALSNECRGYFVFKGGTSLTKAVGCVERFSEDIDILVTGKPDDMSFDRLMKEMAAAVAKTTGLAYERVAGTKNIWRAVRFTYPTRHTGSLRPEIVLEMGRRGTAVPDYPECLVSALLSGTPFDGFDPLAYEDLVAFPVPVLHPARTLWEKVVLLHNEVTTDAWREHPDPSRFARHYGDIGAVLKLPEVTRFLEHRVERARLDEEVRRVSEEWFGGEPAPVPEAGYARSSAFQPTNDFAEFLHDSFAAAVAALWSPKARPTLQGVLDTVASHAELLDPR